MGTRHLICVFAGGKYKVAQYGQWDGYPGGQGVNILDFLRRIDLAKFKERVAECRFMTDDELQEIHSNFTDGGMILHGSDHHKFWDEYLSPISRDTGSKILDYVYYGGVRVLKNSLSFAGDSLFCEWCYVIDLDRQTLEVYRGFNEEPVTEGRFLSGHPLLENDNEYEPVVLIRTYSILDLPSNDEFVKYFEVTDDE